jgi:hypothetical protein
MDNNTTFTLTLTAAEIQIIGEALGQLPFNVVARLISKIQDQVNNSTSNVESQLRDNGTES